MRALRTQLPKRILLLLPPAVLLCITAIVYYPSLHYEFQFDDIANIQKHFQIRTHSLWEQFFKGTRWISNWLNSVYYTIDKFNPYYYRIGNVIIHCMNGLLVFFILLLGLSGLRQQNFFKRNAFPIAFLTALFFLLHPIQTQTVSYVIQGQLEGMAVLSMLAMSLCFLLIGRAQSSVARYSLITLLLILAALSCGTKEIAIVSPILIVLIDWFFVAQGDWDSFKKRWLLHLSIFAIVGICYLVLMRPAFFFELFGLQMKAKNNIGNVITSKPGEMITPWIFCISQFKVMLHYLWVFIWPYGMSVEYDWKLCPSLFSLDCLLPLSFLVAIGFLLWKRWCRDKQNLIVFSVLWFVVFILPRSSIIPSAELMFDYKTYGASLGLFFIMSCVLIWGYRWLHTRIASFLSERNVAIGTVASVVVLACILGVSSYYRNQVWSSGLEFWGDILKKAPGKARAYNNYGVELSTKLKQFEESIPYFKKAIAMDKLYPDPCNNLAVAYANINKIDEAIEAVKQGLIINPYYPEGYNNLSSFLLIKKDYVQAEISAKSALKLRPWYGKAHLNLGRIYLELGRDEQALECFRNACMKADLDNEFGFSCYAQVAMKLQRYDEAIVAYQKLKMINPGYQDIDFNIANAYVLAGQLDKAIAIYERLIQSNSRDFRVVYNCGEAYLKLGKLEKALEYFTRVQPYMHMLPRLGLRIAECYDKLGNRDKSQMMLTQVVNDKRLPDKVKKIAQNMLNQMQQLQST